MIIISHVTISIINNCIVCHINFVVLLDSSINLIGLSSDIEAVCV